MDELKDLDFTPSCTLCSNLDIENPNSAVANVLVPCKCDNSRAMPNNAFLCVDHLNYWKNILFQLDGFKEGIVCVYCDTLIRPEDTIIVEL